MFHFFDSVLDSTAAMPNCVARRANTLFQGISDDCANLRNLANGILERCVCFQYGSLHKPCLPSFLLIPDSTRARQKTLHIQKTCQFMRFIIDEKTRGSEQY